MSKFNVTPSAIVGIGLSGQMHSSIFLDQNKQVIRPAILWNDVRTSAQCRRIENTMDATFCAQDLQSCAREASHAESALAEEMSRDELADCHLVLPKDYIRFRLTGELQMEVSDAAGMII